MGWKIKHWKTLDLACANGEEVLLLICRTPPAWLRGGSSLLTRGWLTQLEPLRTFSSQQSAFESTCDPSSALCSCLPIFTAISRNLEFLWHIILAAKAREVFCSSECWQARQLRNTCSRTSRSRALYFQFDNTKHSEEHSNHAIFCESWIPSQCWVCCLYRSSHSSSSMSKLIGRFPHA